MVSAFCYGLNWYFCIVVLDSPGLTGVLGREGRMDSGWLVVDALG